MQSLSFSLLFNFIISSLIHLRTATGFGDFNAPTPAAAGGNNAFAANTFGVPGGVSAPGGGFAAHPAAAEGGMVGSWTGGGTTSANTNGFGAWGTATPAATPTPARSTPAPSGNPFDDMFG